jgi:hypothetical protein
VSQAEHRTPGAVQDRPSARDASESGRPASANRTARDEDRLGAGWLVLLLPLACCGGPLLIGALAAAGGIAWGGLGVGAAAVLAVVVLIIRRRRARCCPPATQARSTAPRAPTGAGRS